MFRLICSVLLVICCSCEAQEYKVKVACIGNSITYGSGVFNREKNAYPKQLQAMLGSEYLVKNFGVSGRTLLKKGDHPYWETSQYQKALDFKADIVFIKLGTNDSKGQNRVYLKDFKEDYLELIRSFKDKNNDVRIILLLPLPSFLEDSSSIYNPVIKEKIIPLTREVAYEAGVEIVDLYQLFIESSSLLPDKIHPSSLGATKIAKRGYEQINGSTDPKFDLIKNLKLKDYKEHNFYGFNAYYFKQQQLTYKIVAPKRVHKDKPWVWRARFFGHEPQTDIALLERGYHIVYCDVANLFGNSEAVTRWNSFYQQMQTAGLHKKVVLEGMSRGGLIMYNWASENAEKVACVYADAPVLDGKSWPGGFGEGKGSLQDWQQFKKVHKLDNSVKENSYQGDPIHKIEKIVAGGYPMLHICGDADKVVPVVENTHIFASKIKEAGGNIRVIHKKEVGHHPHSLKDPSMIVDFILRSYGHKVNFATLTTPGSEYRSAAGWKKGKDWWAQARDIDSLCKHSGEIDLLLIGNSITQGWGGNRTLTTYKPGQQAADSYFKGLKWISAGISGDQTQHIAWRLQNGSYEKSQAKNVVLTIGVNNFPHNTASEIVEGIIKDLELTKLKFSEARIILLGPLPTGLKSTDEGRIKFNKIHSELAKMKFGKNVSYHNLSTLFILKNGDLNLAYCSGDGIHLKPEGYKIWGNFIKQQIEK